ncbi:MAG: 3'(2'),5'-bisphosphate nucleotidase CysQ [Bdellovibrionota bacterium]|nr:3'(2'),5'-bisphosphate nucleotidase CysQ [Bdellovibrionota bacterium]
MRELIDTVRAAGVEILKVYAKDDLGIEIKADQTPITLADEASNRVITENLKKLFPEIPILSEEGEIIDYNARSAWSECFIVDPLDGTKEFIKRNGEFTVNIGLWRDGEIKEGIVYAPVNDVLYFTSEGSAFRIKEGVEEKLPCMETETFTVAVSNSHISEITLDHIETLKKKYGRIDLKRIGSSLKMCQIAEGSVDYYPRLGPTSEWDTAAAHAILKACGGNIYEFDSKKELTYNKENILNPHFYAQR